MSKRRIAVLGGGVGAMTTAYHITSSPGWSDRFELTVYQMGWRLGGKGASGRNQAIANRIEEHGLHIWMGFYENAFRIMRDAYRECNEQGLTPGSPFTSWDKAFSPLNLIVLTEQSGDTWNPWQMYWPPNQEVPGVDSPDTPKTTWECVLLLIWHALKELESLTLSSLLHGESWGVLMKEVESGLGQGCLLPFGKKSGSGSTLLHDVHVMTKSLPADTSAHPPEVHAELVAKLDRFRKGILNVLEKSVQGWPDDLRRSLLVMDTALTIVRGMLADGVLERGFESIDNLTFTQWMAKHGAWQPDSVLTRGMYDSSFAYRDGNPETPDFAAGTTLYGSMRLMFTYKGSIMWHMNAGMGDTIFSPLYLLLKQRGVKFEFFHKVTALHATPDGKGIGSIDIDVQIQPKPELPQGYDPLITVNGVPSWPNQPLYDQLAGGEDLKNGRQNGRTLQNPNLESWWTDWEPVGKRTLVLGEHFDDVVLGISLGALPYICEEMIQAQPSWRLMADNVRVVRTQGLQVWLNRTRDQVGWKSPYNDEPLLCAYYEPFDTWSDMTHLLPRESWAPADGVVQLAYFCNTAPNDPDAAPFSQHGYPASQDDIVNQNAQTFLARNLTPIWPDWQDNAIVSQFTRINIDPSEYYVQSVAGSTQYRLRSWDSGYGNLVLAGDWTRTDVNIGCVEAATMSGVMASHAICGYPKTIYGAFGRRLPLDKDDPRTIDAMEEHLRGKKIGGE